MIRRLPRCKRADTLFPDTTLFRSKRGVYVERGDAGQRRAWPFGRESAAIHRADRIAVRGNESRRAVARDRARDRAHWLARALPQGERRTGRSAEIGRAHV